MTESLNWVHDINSALAGPSFAGSFTMVDVQYIGWEPNSRFLDERERVTEHVKKFAQEGGYSFAVVQ